MFDKWRNLLPKRTTIPSAWEIWLVTFWNFWGTVIFSISGGDYRSSGMLMILPSLGGLSYGWVVDMIFRGLRG